jgi:hypothetical protein
LLEVDMTGFAPICGHVQTTSFYFERQFNVPPLGDRQPLPGIGSRDSNWERPFVLVAGPQVECDGEIFRGVGSDRMACVETPRGPLHTRIVTYLGGDDDRAIAVLDVDRNRVLVSQHQPDTDEEIARIAGLPFDQFRAFVNAHPLRRCQL